MPRSREQFGGSGIKMLRAERAEQLFAHFCVAADHVEGVPTLGHGALSEHFAGNEERGAPFFHDLARLAHHQDLAVDAGVHDLAEAVRRTFTQETDEGFAHIHRLDFEPVDLFPVRDELRLAEEGGDEVQATDNKPLLHDQPGSEDAVQTAGKQGERVRSGCLHDRHSTAWHTRTQAYPAARPKRKEGDRSPSRSFS